MKVGIATLYNCFNFGSYLQAFAMQKTIENFGAEVKLLNLDTWYYNKYRIKSMLTKNAGEIIFNWQQFLAYKRDWKKLNISAQSDIKNREKYDSVILGSDEIWNINNRTFDHIPQYFGGDLNTNNIIAYAPSSGGAGYNDIVKSNKIVEAIKSINSVSARDEKTQNILFRILNREIPMVLDPTFLIDWGRYHASSNKRDFILVYSYSGKYGFSEDKIKLCKEIAKKYDLPLVSPGFYNIWCDEIIPCSPLEFLGLLNNAAYVITDTFHGTVMSIQYEKQVGIFIESKHKVSSLLNMLNLNDRDMSGDNINNIGMFDNHIDYVPINKKIEELKGYSIKYLKEALNI